MFNLCANNNSSLPKKHIIISHVNFIETLIYLLRTFTYYIAGKTDTPSQLQPP
jgi:hypothetical protein